MTGHGVLRGVQPVFATPFKDNEELDLEALASELNWMADQGIDGLVMGMVSETLRLSGEERSLVTRVTCDVATNRNLASIISVGAESTDTAVSFARTAEESGATALMAIPPISEALPDSEVKAYYKAILNGTGIPLVVQDASGYVGRPFSIQLQAELLDEYGPRVLFKPEATPIGPRLSALRDATGGHAQVFEGTGGIALIDSYRRGIVGTMPGPDLCWALVLLWQLLGQDDFDSAYDLAAPLVSLVAIQSSLDSFVSVEKHLLKRQGVLPNSVARRPHSFELDQETCYEVDRLFDQLRSKFERANSAVSQSVGMEQR